jgi:hypothetical protein
VIKIRSTTSFGGEVKPSVPCRRFTACKRTLRAWIEPVVLASKIQAVISHPSLLTAYIRIDRTAARPVGRSPTATNAHDSVTSERGGPSPYRAVEPWLLLYIIIKNWKSARLSKATWFSFVHFINNTTVRKLDTVTSAGDWTGRHLLRWDEQKCLISFSGFPSPCWQRIRKTDKMNEKSNAK